VILVADAMELPLRDASVQCVVTSPPYYGLRKYAGVQEFVWEHADGTTWTGALGGEPTPEMYVAHLVEVFGEIRRVLAPSGTVFLNIGDSYARTGGTDRVVPPTARVGNTKRTIPASEDRTQVRPRGYKDKDRLLIPAQVALALRADGWYLRDEIIWHKPNTMPASITDRTTCAHEMVYLLTKRPRYYYDADALRTPYAEATIPSRLRAVGAVETYTGQATKDYVGAGAQDPSDTKRRVLASIARGKGANARSVWKIATQPFKGAHFATMPKMLAERCIKAGSKPGDIVLDPFGGSGTVALVAQGLGRRGVCADLAHEYAVMAHLRLQGREREIRQPDKQAGHGRRHAGFNERYFGRGATVAND